MGAHAILIGDTIILGVSFCDAVLNKGLKSHGTIKMQGRKLHEYNWKSSFDCKESEGLLRGIAESDGMKVTFLMSQAIA